MLVSFRRIDGDDANLQIRNFATIQSCMYMELGRPFDINLIKCWNRSQVVQVTTNHQHHTVQSPTSPHRFDFFFFLFRSLGFSFCGNRAHTKREGSACRAHTTRAETPCSINYTAYYKFSHAFGISACCICVCNQNFSRLVVVPRRVPSFFLLFSICVQCAFIACAVCMHFAMLQQCVY